eukprot:1237273-Pleurochrysis_carterae.AAC.1
MPPPPAPSLVCSYAFLTKFNGDVSATGLRPCYSCAELRMHYHSCALDDKVRGRATDPGGQNTSLCAKCGGVDEAEAAADGNENDAADGAHIVRKWLNKRERLVKGSLTHIDSQNF